MKKSRFFLASVVLVFSFQYSWAHPGSGIAVDREGVIYFIDTGGGVWKIDTEGKLVKFHSNAYHWMALDDDGRFAAARLDDLQTPSQDVQKITADGARPTLITSSDFPIAVGPDGNLYYPVYENKPPLKIVRRSPDAKTTVLATFEAASDGSPLKWINGIAAGADGSIYIAENDSVRKVSPQGRISTVVSRLQMDRCSPHPVPESPAGPYLRGLAVDSRGTVYVAASGCRSLLKITRDGKTETILTVEPPWSPTAVAVRGDVVYVQEYTHTPGDNRQQWVPRIRRISSDGKVSNLATVSRP